MIAVSVSGFDSSWNVIREGTNHGLAVNGFAFTRCDSVEPLVVGAELR